MEVNMNKIVSVLNALTLVASLMVSNPSAAAGALAVGSTGNIAKDGIAVENIIDAPSETAAADKALDACHKNSSVTPHVRSLCRIVETFTRKMHCNCL
jgi:hypothetical protein